MSRTKQIAVAGGTFAVALGIGFVMQNGDALAGRSGPDLSDALPPAPVVVEAGFVAPQSAGPVVMVPDLPEAETAQLLPDPAEAEIRSRTPVQLAAVEDDVALPAVPERGTAQPEIAADDCTVALTGEAQPAAMAVLTMSFPCQPNARVTLHHQGMIITVMTDETGHAEVAVPALAENAVFIAALPNGEGAMTSLRMPDVALFDRAVLLWQGETGLGLHALEFGAQYDEPGHVWNGSPGDPGVDETSGFLVRLGDAAANDPYMAEIYTFPSGVTSATGEVQLSVEAEITPDNCDQQIAAQSIQIFPNAETEAADLVMAIPACDAVGDYLVLKNMLRDLKLAAR